MDSIFHKQTRNRALSSCNKSQGDLSLLRMQTMFPQVQALPCAQCGTAIGDRDANPRLGENAAYMGRHIIFAFVDMGKHGITIGNQSVHKGFQIVTDIRIGVLAEY